MMTQDSYVDIKEVSRHFNLSVSTIRGLIRKDEIPYIKVGNVYRFNLVELKNFFEQSSTKSSQTRSNEIQSEKKTNIDPDLLSPLSKQLFISYNLLWGDGDAREILAENLNSLSKKEQFLVRLFTGVPQRMTIQEIADFTDSEMKEIIQNIESVSRKLMHPSRFHKLQDLYEAELSKHRNL